MPVPAPVELPPRYYRDNFERLVDVVRSQYDDLLDLAEREFLRAYEAATEEARCLYIRLVSRRGPLFRSELLSYPELGELDGPIAELIQLSLVEFTDAPSAEELFRVLRKAELQAIFAEDLGEQARASKADIERVLLERLQEADIHKRWLEWRQPGMQLLRPGFGDVIELMRLLFFGNRRQGLTDFVLSDLGVMRYESYPLGSDNRLFASRSQVHDYLYLADLSEQFYEALELDEHASVLALIEPLLDSGATPLLESRRDKLRNRVARQLERWDYLEQALTLYKTSGQAPARERCVRILQRGNELTAALALCRDMEASPWCESEADFVRRQTPQIAKKIGEAFTPIARDRFDEEHIVLPRAERVELAAADYYQGEWECVHYVENSLVNAVFGLAFWEQMFMPLPGAFVNPFQSAPRDMYSREFYLRRSEALDARMRELLSGDLAVALLKVFDSKQGIANSWINWRYLDRELLSLALTLIPAAHWRVLWERILFDPVENRSGFPDLIALDSKQGYSFIEVKGPGDQLQLNQRRWLRYFQQHDIPARVSWVSWQDAADG